MRTVLALGFLAAGAAAQQGAVETEARSSRFPAAWPAGPSRESMPAWAAAGKIRFARWDGGRIETAKAFLSGWPGFNPPIPDFVESMTNWYTLPTVELLREAAINTIWVTFSNGFSIATERAHMEQLKAYIEACHRAGIRVLAYQSIANIFWEDMFAQVPESKEWVRIGPDGKPTPYGAAAYAKMGRTTRYMARIAHPGWQDYLRKRVDLALDAGADGVFYDNNFNEALAETYQAIYKHAAARKRDVILMGNFHENTYVLNRLTNALSTEDGLEPGVYAAANVGGRLEKSRPYLLPAGGGFLVNNIGLFRMHAALTDGWKPVMIEHGHRETGDRFSNAIPAPRHQLAIAEAAAAGGAFQVFSEGRFADGLYRRKPEAMEIWQAIARYNRFLRDNEALYTGASPAARIAVIADESSEGVPLLNGLAARNVQFQVLYEHDVTPGRLQPFRAIAVVSMQRVRPRALQALKDWTLKGGRLLMINMPAGAGEEAKPRAAVDEVTSALLDAAGPPPARLDAAPGVVYVAAVQARPARLLVHLLNYTGRQQRGIKVTVPGECRKPALVSPDGVQAPGFAARAVAGTCVVEVARVGTYSVMVFEPAAN